jgi:GNAT superfamily N-acetyltransferase
VIRVADASDLSALTPLIERYWEFERIKGFDAARITTLLADLFRGPDRGQIWIAQLGGRSVGYLLVVYLFSLEHGGLMAEIDEFFVVPEKRSLKIGTAFARGGDCRDGAAWNHTPSVTTWEQQLARPTLLRKTRI